MNNRTLQMICSQKNEMELKLNDMQGVLSPPQPLGSSLLLPRPWALLLRVLLQQGVPEQLLQQLTQPSLGDESALESAVWSLFPEDCQKAWQAAPHRMGTAEAQVSPLDMPWSCLSLFSSEDCQKAWQAAPHRMGTADARVSGCNAYGQPVLTCSGHVSLLCVRSLRTLILASRSMSTADAQVSSHMACGQSS